jgi:hypothetical protein
MTDPTPRLWKIGDALSQLANVALLPGHTSTTANESISGRSYRCGWTRAERLINWLFWSDPDHCRQAHLRDLKRAKRLMVGEQGADT